MVFMADGMGMFSWEFDHKQEFSNASTILYRFRIVGDRPRGPLKQGGNPHLNPRIEMSWA
jgi:hypothetical protein